MYTFCDNDIRHCSEYIRKIWYVGMECRQPYALLVYFIHCWNTIKSEACVFKKKKELSTLSMAESAKNT